MSSLKASDKTILKYSVIYKNVTLQGKKWLNLEFLLSFKRPFSVIDFVDLGRKKLFEKKSLKKSRNQDINLYYFFLVHVYKYSFCNNTIITQKVKILTLATLSPEVSQMTEYKNQRLH